MGGAEGRQCLHDKALEGKKAIILLTLSHLDLGPPCLDRPLEPLHLGRPPLGIPLQLLSLQELPGSLVLALPGLRNTVLRMKDQERISEWVGAGASKQKGQAKE